MFSSSRSLGDVREGNVPPSFASSRYKPTSHNAFKSSKFASSSSFARSRGFNASRANPPPGNYVASSSRTVNPRGALPNALKSSRFTTSMSFASSKGLYPSRLTPPHLRTSSSEDDAPSCPRGPQESAELPQDLTELQANQIEGMSTVRFVFDEPEHDKPKKQDPKASRMAHPSSKTFQTSRPYIPMHSSFTASIKHSMAHALTPSGGFATSRCRPISEGDTGESQSTNRDFQKSKPGDCPLRPTDPRYYCSQFTTFMEQESFTVPSRFKMSSLKPKSQPNLKDPTFKSSRFVSIVGAKPKFANSNSSVEATDEGLDFDCDDFGYFLEKKKRDSKKIIHVNNIIRSALLQFFGDN